MKKFRLAAVIGRFQPFHNGHLDLLRHAAGIAEQVVVIIGSTEQPRSLRNPFTFEERRAMIGASCSDIDPDVLSVPDTPYDLPAWQQRVQLAVASVSPSLKKGEVTIVGCNKDSSTFYLGLFPQWTHTDPLRDGKVDVELNATIIREQMFNATHVIDRDREWWLKVDGRCAVPEPVASMLTGFVGTPEFQSLQREHEFVRDYRARMRFVGAPYAPTMQTVDAVVIQGGHVVLVKRGSFPGKGLGALPGGYVNQDETLIEAAIRELREETLINVPDNIIRSSIIASMTFDDPHRDPRGRVFTQAFLIDLDHELQNRIRRWGTSKSGLSRIEGGDDAAKATWVPVSELDPQRMYADHYHIIGKMLGFKK